ncbi:hypothetical protein AGR56_15095 [Clostridium sp. DMHC 10]|nr:hypothetical protein AGR56_15095 [Clostridium sp. DMHC 10]
MKGIVMEELEYKLIILTEKGDFVEVDKSDRKVQIGEEIIIKRQKINIEKTFRRFALAAAAIFIIILASYSIYGSFFTREYVIVSINPSNNKNAAMEIHYNYFTKIVKLQGANKRGSVIVRKIDRSQFKSTSTVINKFIKVAQDENVISQKKENTIVITIASSSKKINDESIDSSVEHYIRDNKINAKAMIVLGDEIDYKKSKQIGVPIDKFILINEAIKKNPSYKFNDLNKKSVEELINIANRQGNYE